MAAILINISKVPSAIFTSGELVCQVTKKVSYDLFSVNVQNCYEKRGDLSFLKINIAKPILFALEAKNFFNWSVLPRKTEAGLIDVAKTLKGFAELWSTVPTPLYKLFDCLKTCVLESRFVDRKDLDEYFLFLPNERRGPVEAVLRNVVAGTKFFKDFSEGFSLISKKIFNNVSLVDYAPRVSRVLSWAIDSRVACVASLVSAFYDFKDVSLSDMQGAVAKLKKLKSGDKLDEGQSLLVKRVLQGISSLFIGASMFLRIFNERVGGNRALGFCALAANGASVGVGVLSNRWQIAMPKPPKS